MDARKAALLSEKQAFSELESTPSGLSQREAERRAQKYGLNEVPQKKAHPLLKLAANFWGPIPWMIELALALSAVLGKWEDFYVILFMLLVNALVSFWREYKAEREIESLQKKVALRARVLRDGAWQALEARLLVPGDVIRLRVGDIVPADAKLLDDAFLVMDESLVTGESLPAEKSGGNAVFSATHVVRGEATALVVATGANSLLGTSARVLSQAKKASHLQQEILSIGRNLIYFAAIVVSIVMLLQLWRGAAVADTLHFALVLLVASIPVALPAVLTVTLAIGATKLAENGVIVSRLATIEELAGMQVLLADKTGTLTLNNIEVAQVLPLGGFTEKDVLLYAGLCSKREDNDPIDNAVIRRGQQAGADSSGAKLGRFEPFDPKSKRSQATATIGGRKLVVTKGAAQAIAELVGQGPETKKAQEAVARFGERGMRALAVAVKQGARWKYAGVLALRDQVRPDAAPTVQQASEMGVQVKMITGDNEAVARQVAAELGLPGEVLDPSALGGDGELAGRIANSAGFAQAFPEHKYAIAKALQQEGYFVGMTGDGVNDAPALRQADVGIAVAGATDVAREAADLVLATNGLAVIIDAIRESRRIFERMFAYALYRLAETIRVLVFTALAVLVFGWYPLTPIMIVLLAVLNDLAIITISYDNTIEPQKPVGWNTPVLLKMSAILGAYGLLSSFLLLYAGQAWLHLGQDALQTMMYLKLSLAGHLMIFHARTRKIFWTPLPSKILVAATLGTQLIATAIAVYGIFLHPISWKLAALVWAYALGFFVLFEPIKAYAYRKLGYSGM